MPFFPAKIVSDVKTTSFSRLFGHPKVRLGTALPP
jgi:hypothetical protein